MREAIRHGYLPGGGLRSADKRYFYLGIPKNASTYLSNTLLANGWHYHTLGDDSDKICEAFVVLKEPCDRWISGLGTYISSWILGPAYGSDHFIEDYNELSERLLFESMILDDHTTPQARYVSQLAQLIPEVPVTYFRLNSNVIDNISTYLNQELKTPAVDNNASEDNYDQRQIINFLKDRLVKDFALRAKVIARFQEDYNLINSIKFYHGTR